jgi:hypothetical protein
MKSIEDRKMKKLLIALVITLFSTSFAYAADYNFKGGFPAGNTVKDAYDASDHRRAVEAYKIFLPTMSTEAVIQQMLGQGAKPNEIGMVMATSPMQQFGGPNSDTPYALALLDLKDGPMVIELPANPLLLGLVNDHNMKWIQNVGGIGPAKGKGGKHLFLPPDYEGNVPEGYFVSRSKTWKVVAVIRTVPLDGDLPKSIKAAQEVKVYPLSKAGDPATHYFIDVSKKRVTLPLLDWEGKFEYWRQLHKVVNSETSLIEYRYVLGFLSELGIEKGKPFKPDSRLKRILTEAAEMAHQEMIVNAFSNRRPERMVWEDRKWEWLPIGPFDVESGDFGTSNVSDIGASDQYFFLGWGTSSSIGKRQVGSGSIYYMGYRDNTGAFLDGGKNYKLTIPGPIPAGLFWSLTVYDAKTRVLIETKLGRAAIRSHLDKPEGNADGSYDIYIGPKAPQGKENNWIQSNAGEGWWSCVRLYSPKASAFDGSWRLSDFVEMK